MGVAVIINPTAQGGTLGKRWPSMAKTLRRNMGSFRELFTEKQGDATLLARKALLAGATTIVAVGGDGTINEVVNGFFEKQEPVSENATLGILPFGTGGDFRRSLNLPKDLQLASEVLGSGATQPLDVGWIEYTSHSGTLETRAFINIASFGISGLVDEIVNSSQKRLGGKLGFFLATAKAQLSYQNQRCRLTFDGENQSAVETTIHSVAVANGRYFGGGMHIAPNAKLDDGHFDIVSLGDWSLGDTVRYSRRFYAGTHLELGKVSVRQAKILFAEPLGAAEIKIDVDGENPGRLPAKFTINRNAIRVIVPGS